MILTTKGIDDMALKVCILVIHAENAKILVFVSADNNHIL